MIRRLLYRYTANRPCKLISRNGVPYLERYFVATTKSHSIYLHRFVGADGDLEVHNHPFDAISIVLAGGYTEEVVKEFSIRHGLGIVLRQVTRFNRISADKYHRIAETQPDTWTLFIHNKRKGRTWCFVEAIPPILKNGVMHWEFTFHQPFPLTTDEDHWWEKCPLGISAGREPMPATRR
jgi:hypothetical protein